ncbi:MAG TPA: hypothetical protein VME40_13105 [Caulobacteraceae bacterium]|nr:hypothetical protein [Caulobacteraceae bacterium]
MRSTLAVGLAALALVGCGRAGSQGAAANVAAAQTGGVGALASNDAATNAALAAGSPPQAAGGGTSIPGPPPSSAPASASTVTIQFQRGANCWQYAGVASTFDGRFAAGQRVDITSTGLQANGNGSENWYETRPRSVYIAGADGKLLTADADGYFTIPASGAYQISFDPMSMVGAPGVMIVCTL